MEPLTGENPEIVALRLEQAVSEAFSSAGWSVEEQPVLGGAKPDFLMAGPEGEHLVVEVKATTEAPLHFGMVAQAAEYAALAKSINQLSSVRSAVLTTAPVSAAARDAADRLGVSVLGPDDDQDVGHLAERWVGLLTASLAGESSRDYQTGSKETLPGSRQGPSWSLKGQQPPVPIASVPTAVGGRLSLRSRRLRIAIGIAIALVVIALGVLAVARSEFSHQSHAPPRVERPRREHAQPSSADISSSPLVPILVAVAALAAISVGAVVIRQRRMSRTEIRSRESLP